MKGLMKAILGLAILVVLLVGGSAAVLLTIDPNSYKSQISTAVKEATGRDLSIAGNIEVLFYPVLGFKVAGLEMGNPDGFSEKDFIKAGEVQAGVKIIPLLSKKIEVTTVRLIEPSITVIKNSNGRTNLEFPKKGEATKAETSKLDISIEGIEVSKAKVTYIDKATGRTTIINPLNLNMPGYAAGRDIDVSLDMVLNNPAPAKPITLDARATMKADPDKGEFSFRNLKSNIDLGGAKVSATADVKLNTKTQEVSIVNLETGWQGTNVKGRADIKGFTKPSVMFSMTSPSVDFDALFPKKVANASADKNKPLLPVESLRTLTLSGDLSIGVLKATELTFNDLKVKVSARDGLLKADPISLNMYDGTLTTQVNIDARNPAPTYNIVGNMKGMEVGQFLTAKMGQDYLTGVANSSFNLNARGNTMDALNKSSSGQVNFDFGKGYINKWQLSKLMNQAISYFETGALDPNASDKVYFTSLDGAFVGQGGVFTNDNLQLIAPKSHALGAGSVNLGRQTVDYTVRVGGGDNPEKFGKKKHLPVRMTGPFAKPAYSIDMQALIQDVAGEKIEEKKQELMENLFKKLDKKAAATEAAPVTESVPDTEPAEPPIQEDPLKSFLKGL